jgi:hypothetical protein
MHKHSIDSTRDALRNNDTAKALQQLNTADTELLKITGDIYEVGLDAQEVEEEKIRQPGI